MQHRELYMLSNLQMTSGVSQGAAHQKYFELAVCLGQYSTVHAM